MSPRADLWLVCDKPAPAGLSIAEFQADFEDLLRKHGMTPNFATEETRKSAPALLALTAVTFGASCDLPQSVLGRFKALRARVGATPCTPDVEVAS